MIFPASPTPSRWISLVRFLTEVEQNLGHELPDATDPCPPRDRQFPPSALSSRLDQCVLERTCPQPAVRKHIKQLWDRLAEELLCGRLVRERDASSSTNLIDGLSRALRFSKRRSSGWTSATTEWLRAIRGAESDSFAGHALTEPDFRNRRAKHVVYGHTHAAEVVPLDASHAEGYVLDQVYFNAGTWRRIHRPASFSPAGHEFIATDVFSYLAFFQGDERKGRGFETWTGTLGHTPAERIIHRIDAGFVLSTPFRPASPTFCALFGNTTGTTARRRPKNSCPMPDYLQVVTTTALREEAERIARELVEARLAACVQIVGPISAPIAGRTRSRRARNGNAGPRPAANCSPAWKLRSAASIPTKCRRFSPCRLSPAARTTWPGSKPKRQVRRSHSSPERQVLKLPVGRNPATP